MKPINQNLRSAIQVVLLALFCFVMTPSAIAAHIWQTEHNNTGKSYSSRTMTETSNQRADPQKSDSIRLLMVADSTANETGEASDKEAEMQAKRQKMIEKCQDNHGTDCENAVDTELEAQQNGIVHTSPPDQSDVPVPRPRPNPRPRPR
jgi:hypothetical protein